MADLRKTLSKLKVVELKEKLQEFGKTPKGLKADLVNQLAEAYEEQEAGSAGHSAPIQAYQTPATINELPPNESQHYYQQSVQSFPMPGQQVYEQTPPYIQTPYEQQYQYPTHPVFSPTHEQQYTQSPTQYQLTTQLSPRINTQLSPQLTQQLSPQMAQQYRQDFQTQPPFPPNEPETYPTEYAGQTAPEPMSHYGMPHLDMHSIPQTQVPIPPTHVVHRPPVIENYVPEIPQTQSLPPNMAQNLSAFKPAGQAFIPTHPSMVTNQDMIDFDDLAVDPTNESHFNPTLVPFGSDQNQFVLASAQYPREVTDGQTFSHSIDTTNRLPVLDTEDTNDETNDATNDDSTTDVDSNDTNNSSADVPTNDDQTSDSPKNTNDVQMNEEINPTIDSNTSENTSELISESKNESLIIGSNELTEESKQSESSSDSVQTDVESVKEEEEEVNQFIDSNQKTDILTTDCVIKSVADPIQTVQTSEQPIIEPIIEDKLNVVNEDINIEIKSEEEMKEPIEPSIPQSIHQSIASRVETPPVPTLLVEPIVSAIQTQVRPPMKTTITVAKEEPKSEERVKQNGITNELKNKKLSKNQKKKQRKRLKANRRLREQELQKQNQIHDNIDDKMDIEEEEVEIEYIPEPIKKDPMYFQYIKVFDKFRTGESDRRTEVEDEIIDPVKKMMERKKPVELELKDEDERRDGELKISKRKLKQMTRMTVSELKQRVSHPELVEMHDVTARDPLLLLHLKATRNSVPVPRHWCYKRKYLQGKRGFEKPPFKLPEFIRKTGIMEMRQALQEKEESKSLKAQMREKIRPKMGKIDIDYQKLHDAFFKWQTKPKMTIHGDLYYEGKEFETRLKEKKPGELSNELRTALGMPTGPNSQKCPPPWLIAMQRYGPPPSYPNIKVAGLNAPIPEGCSFGYHAGGWGKPPVDEYGRPLYGDVFGVSTTGDQNIVEEEVDRTVWGEMEDESEEEEESESEEEETETNTTDKPSAKEVDETGFVTPAEGLITPSGLSSITAGMETPDMIELRKRKQIEAEMESGDNPALFTVIPEKKGEKLGREMMGSAHTYDMSTATLRKGQGVDVALDPSDLEGGALDTAQMAARYEQSMKERSSHLAKEDLSDMVAEHNARQKRKKPQDTSKSNKKYQFKF